ncbi:MAG: hypothetical protein C4334_10200 [Pyrinomonas sp.]
MLALVAYDVYATILHSRARVGPISSALSRSIWRVARLVSSRRSRQSRHIFLSALGPTLPSASLRRFRPWHKWPS